jgi:hypothetical protein
MISGFSTGRPCQKVLAIVFEANRLRSVENLGNRAAEEKKVPREKGTGFIFPEEEKKVPDLFFRRNTEK